jgi:lysophospholipase L1-like esterase
MTLPSQTTYLSEVTQVLKKHWPDNRAVNIVCHGHSVPAGYFATPMVDSLNAYPHLLHAALKHRFPFAVVNVIVTAIGGETSESGATRFKRDVLCHRPDVITIDYALNDRGIGLERALASWTSMIADAKKAGAKIILLTPTADKTQAPDAKPEDKAKLVQHANQVRRLAKTNSLGLADSLAAFQRYAKTGHISDLLSWANHPNRLGHEIVARELLRWFPAG